MRFVRDREGKRPGFKVRTSWGEPTDSEKFGLWLGRLVGLVTITVTTTVLLITLLYLVGGIVFDIGGLPLATVTVTVVVVGSALILTLRLKWIARYRYEGPIAHRAAKIVIDASEDAIALTLEEAIIEFESIGFDGFLDWLTWRRDNHSRHFYQALVDSLDRITAGESPLLAGNFPSDVAEGLKIADVTRNIKELNSLANSIFRVVHRYELILVDILYIASTPLIAGTAFVLIGWSSNFQQGIPLW
jgi:hypothetical protein